MGRSLASHHRLGGSHRLEIEAGPSVTGREKQCRGVQGQFPQSQLQRSGLSESVPSVETQSEAYRAGEGDISRFDQAEQPARSTIPSF